MAVVPVEIRPKNAEPTGLRDRLPVDVPAFTDVGEVELIADMEQFVEHAACSCNAGDDNPY